MVVVCRGDMALDSLYIFELKEKKDLEKRKFVKLVILILGLAPGLRNFFRLIMGV